MFLRRLFLLREQQKERPEGERQRARREGTTEQKMSDENVRARGKKREREENVHRSNQRSAKRVPMKMAFFLHAHSRSFAFSHVILGVHDEDRRNDEKQTKLETKLTRHSHQAILAHC